MVKPGIKSTEFLLALIASLLFAAQELVLPESTVGRIVAGGVAVLTALGYIASRARVKTAAVLAEAERVA